MPTLTRKTIAIVELQASEQVFEALTDFGKELQLFRVAIGSYERAEEMADPQLPGLIDQAPQFPALMDSRGNDLIDAGRHSG